MGRQIGPIMQAHGIWIELGRAGGEQAGEEAAEQLQHGRHFVTSFQVAVVAMAHICASRAHAAMDKVAAAL
jgi:hypothetical protein